MVPRIVKDLCTGCESCLAVCPVEAISIFEGVANIDEEFCEECGMCFSSCPAKAIVIEFPKLEVS
ncbi:MAG: 4Fe-4S binding protein [Desulfobacterota bacterium]|nr:4Fe-4S binding protein [Thermodesulfobacteriota bacterium]MDW8002354.1 4Fe-4S binding protein [Deltaproteobacteria bacterium]